MFGCSKGLVLVLAGSALCAQSFRGRVVEDQSGTALPSANVRVATPRDRMLAADLETDREGRFDATGLPVGEYQLEISRAGYASMKLTVPIAANGADVTARLIKRGAISGRVQDQQNQPLAGATVFALPKPPGREGVRPPKGNTPAVQTDSKGEFRIHNLPPGEYVIAATFGASTRSMGSMGMEGTLKAFGSGFAFYPSNSRPEALSIANGEEHRNILVTVTTGAKVFVSGRVDPKPDGAFFILALLDVNQPAFSVAVTQSAADGTFKFTGIPVGSYRLVAATTARARNGMGFLLASEPVFGVGRVNVTGQDVADVVIAPDAARTVEFALKNAVGCTAAAQVELTQLEDWGSQLTRTIALKAGERAKITGLAPARYAVASTSTTDKCYVESESILDLSEGAPPGGVEVALAPAGVIKGRLDAGGRNPQTFSIALAPAQDVAMVELASPDVQGRFGFASLRPGRYKMGAFPAGERVPDVTKMFEFEVRGGATAQVDLQAPVEVRQ